MNAIRMGAALGLVMMSWEPWSKNEHAKALGFIALACVFHYSMIVLLPVYFCVRNNSKLILLFVALVPLAYVLHFSLKALSIFDMLNLTFVTIKSNAYKEAEINELPVFSTVLVMRMVVIALVFYFREALEKECSLFYLLFKLYCVGFFIVVTFADMPTVALRLLDIFACTELILLPMLCYRVEPRWPAILGVTGYAVFYFFLYFIKAEYLKPYELII